jgi:hypothetical protein
MRAVIQTTLPATADRVWSLTRRGDTLTYIARGLVSFGGPEGLPEQFIEGSAVDVRILFFGFIPAWRHHLAIRSIDDARRELLSNEHGGLVRVWNHLIRVEPLDNERCRYTDDLEIQAGFFTPLVWLYAHVFYRYRQRRWRSWLRIAPE